jgi:MobA/MobL family
MAVYFLRCKHLSRGKGARVTRAAAYRAGERIRDERTSEVYDHSDRDDVAYKEVVLPTDLAGREDMAWTQDRATLWNAAEHAGLRRNSRLAREWLVLVPLELTAHQRARLVSTFARELADKYRCAVDVCVHLPRPGADSRNHHAHLLMTTREVTPDGLGRRTNLELAGSERRLFGIPGSTKDEYVALRERWAQVTNEAFRQAGLKTRIDHRSFKHQGVNREPAPIVPAKVFYAERQSQKGNAAGNAIRAAYRERVQARARGPAELSRVQENQQARLKATALEDSKRKAAQPKKIPWAALTREERNARRRELRAIERTDPVAEAKRRAVRQAEHQKRKQRNPEALKEAARQWRAAHPEKSREAGRRWWATHGEEVNRKKREFRKYRTQELSRSKSTSPSAEESAQRWKKYRETHGPGPTAEESARNWQAMRERGAFLPEAQTPGTRERDREVASRDDEDDDRKPRRQHDHDFEL